MYVTVATPGGFVVAFQRPDGKLTAHAETHLRNVAEREAARLNEARRAEAAQQRLRDLANPERRPVRWFEPDAFA